jgi:hypothetical protein
MKLKRRNRIIFFTVSLAVLLTFSRAHSALAQMPTPTPSEEEKRLQQEKALLDLKKGIEEDKKAIRDAQPQASATPLAGDTTLTEGVRLETEIVSYKAMAEAAKIISAEIKHDPTASGATAIAIYDGQTIKDWRFYQALFPSFKGYVQDLKDRYLNALCADADTDAQIIGIYCSAAAPVAAAQAAIPAAVIPSAFAAGTTFVKSFIDLAALFRTDTKIEGKSVTIDQNALVAEVLRRLRIDYGANLELYNPGMFPPRKFAQSETITIVGELFLFKKEADRLIELKEQKKILPQQQLDQNTATLKQLKDELDQVEALLEKLKNLNAALKKARKPAVKKAIRAEITKAKVQLGNLQDKDSLKAQIAGLKPTIDADKATLKALDTEIKTLTEINDRFQSFVDEFLKVGPSGSNALALFIKSEDIDQIMNSTTSYWLEIRSVTAGGNNRTRKNLIWFFAGARVDHSGGVVLEYTLYDHTGAVVKSDKLSRYEGYVEPKKIMQKREKAASFEDPQ